jgi:hypothetical protein
MAPRIAEMIAAQVLNDRSNNDYPSSSTGLSPAAIQLAIPHLKATANL